MSNGGIIGPAIDADITSSSGVWNLNDVNSSRNVLNWPRSPRTLTYRANTTGSGTTAALTLTHPADVAIGDLCVLFHNSWDDDDDSIITAPSGFNIIYSRGYEYASITWLSTTISYRVLTSTATVTLPIAVSTADGGSGVTPDNQAYTALYFYLDRSIETIRMRQVSYTQAAAANPAARTLNTDTHTNVPILVLGALTVNSGTPAFNASTSPTFDSTVLNTAATNIETIVGYKIYNTTPGSTTIDSDQITGAGGHQLIALSLSVQ